MSPPQKRELANCNRSWGKPVASLARPCKLHWRVSFTLSRTAKPAVPLGEGVHHEARWVLLYLSDIYKCSSTPDPTDFSQGRWHILLFCIRIQCPYTSHSQFCCFLVSLIIIHYFLLDLNSPLICFSQVIARQLCTIPWLNFTWKIWFYVTLILFASLSEHIIFGSMGEKISTRNQ